MRPAWRMKRPLWPAEWMGRIVPPPNRPAERDGVARLLAGNGNQAAAVVF